MERGACEMQIPRPPSLWTAINIDAGLSTKRQLCGMINIAIGQRNVVNPEMRI